MKASTPRRACLCGLDASGDHRVGQADELGFGQGPFVSLAATSTLIRSVPGWARRCSASSRCNPSRSTRPCRPQPVRHRHDRSNGVGDGVRPFQQHVTVSTGMSMSVRITLPGICCEICSWKSNAGTPSSWTRHSSTRRSISTLESAKLRGKRHATPAPTPRVLRRIHE